MDFQTALSHLPIFAVLRGIKPEEAVGVGEILIEAGFRMLEVTMNSPDPLKSIEALVDAFADDALIGAGTVRTTEEVNQVIDLGAKLIVSPHMNVDVIRETKRLEGVSVPGCLTPTECFVALEAGADAMKIFPAEILSPPVIKAMRAVLPPESKVFVVGGVNAGNMDQYLAVGANGFGIGSALFKPGKSMDQMRADAAAQAGVFKAAREKANQG